jgi:hypothetical protein
MKLGEFLSEKRSSLLDKWFDEILKTYPADSQKFLRKKNRFSNPVGQTIIAGMEKIFDALLSGSETGSVVPFLDDIVRVRAVQDFTPSQAVSFIFSLKTVVREELKEEGVTPIPYEELLAFESRVDSLALACFDIFVKCREKLYDIKANELRNMTFRILQRANRLGEDREEKPGSSSDADDNNNKRGNS